MFIVMGATGHVGAAVAEALLTRGKPVTILTRHPERATSWRDKGAMVAFADADDERSLHSVMRGAERAFLLSPPADPKEDTDATELRTVANMLSALHGTKLEKVVAASTYGAQPGRGIGDFTTLWELEEGLRQLSVPAAINRGAYYMSNWLAFADLARQSAVKVQARWAKNPANTTAAKAVVAKTHHRRDVLSEYATGQRSNGFAMGAAFGLHPFFTHCTYRFPSVLISWAMGSKHFRGVYDFQRADADAVIKCRSCGHVGRLQGMKLVELLGAMTSLAGAERRLRCQSCGKRGARLAPIPRL